MAPSSALLFLLAASNLQPGSSHARFAYDCENGYKHWRAAWEPEKKAWCCSYVERGCPGDQHHEEIFDCEDSQNTWRIAWSREKQGWCCENSQTWSNAHQKFCCEIKRGCHLDERGVPFNCNKGVQAHWSKKEAHWCCRNEPPKGCHIQQDTTSAPFHCLSGLSGSQVSWSKRKQNWCCQHKDLGCPRQNEKNPNGNDDMRFKKIFNQDCSKDFNNRRHWPKHKICHCCKHFGIACPPVYYPPHIPDHVVVCDNIQTRTLYDISSGPINGTELAIDYDPKDEASKATPRRAAASLAACSVFALSMGIVTLMAARAGVRRICRGGYAAVSEKAGESFLATEEGTKQGEASDA